MVSKLLSIAVVVSLSGAGALLPMTAYGATAAELQAQITALLAQIQALQSQLSSSSSSVSSGSVPASLLSSGNLTLGSKGAAVMDLQKFLNANGAQVAASGAGSSGNETSTFGPLTKAALAKWQAANGVSPAAGFFGSLTRAKLAVISGGVVSTPSTPLIPKVATTTVITELVVITASTSVIIPVLPNPFDSTLKIEGIFQSRTYSTYGNKILNEFKLTADEKIGITRIKFKNNGTFSDAYLANIQLINSKTEKVVATVDTPVDKIIEFKMTWDSIKPDNGLVVSGETYYIYAYILTPNIGQLKPKIQLDIELASDISAFDYNDLTRVANVTKNNIFPIVGPTLTIW